MEASSYLSFWNFKENSSQHCSALLRITPPTPAGPDSHVLTVVPELEEWADLTVKGADLAADWRLPQGLPRVIRVQ